VWGLGRMLAASIGTEKGIPMLKPVFALCPILIFLPLVFAALPAQQPVPEAPTAIPAEAVKVVNPVRVSPESTAKAEKAFTTDCVVCHGVRGNAKGDLSHDFKVKDFTKPGTLQDRTDGELFYIIKNGMGRMPPEGDRATADEVWNLVVLVRSFPAGKK
jgi:mono/diheme cytochrome c family protein